jgi:hypothetical protein
MYRILILFMVGANVLAQSDEEVVRNEILWGAVVGITYVAAIQEDFNRKIQEMYPDDERNYYPLLTQFGINFEQRIRLGSTKSHFAFQEVFTVGGIDQGIALPFFNFLVGFKSHKGLQFGLGPDFVARWTKEELELAVSVVYAVGWTFSFYGAYVPVSLAVVPTPDDGHPRFSLISGFNFILNRK